jgi:Nif-specific regulatory protein
MFQAEKKTEYFDAQALHSLREVTRTLNNSRSRTQAGLDRTLEILSHHQSVLRSAILLCTSAASEIQIEACRGLNQEEHKAFMRAGEGMVDRVLETGKPELGPKFGGDSSSLQADGTHSINHLSDRILICFPLNLRPRTRGALLVEMERSKNRDYAMILAFLEVLAFIIRHAMEGNLEREGRPALVEVNPPREEIRKRIDLSNLVGNSDPMQLIYDQIGKVARSNATVMLRGESGTGKELIAHAVHCNSSRKTGPFIKVNCAALPDTLIESELFGYEKGAFTGALTQKKGRFELAEGGTLFLDEIGEVNPAMAVKLLRILQEREFERVGGTQTLKANVRLIVATNKDLEKAIAAGNFREDLFYRLNVFTIFLPPLRERKPDIPLLADHFLAVFTGAHEKNIRRISTQAIDVLMSHHWPGNVRELANTIERAVLLCDDETVHCHHLPPSFQSARNVELAATKLNVSLKQSVDAYERELILDTLKTTRGNRARAARILRTTERVINYKAKKFGMDDIGFK